jgi:hypothetical protein
MQALIRQLRRGGSGLSSAAAEAHNSVFANASTAASRQTQCNGSRASAIAGLLLDSLSADAQVAALGVISFAGVSCQRHRRHMIDSSCRGSASASGMSNRGSAARLGSTAASTASLRGFSASATREQDGVIGRDTSAEQPVNLNPLQAWRLGTNPWSIASHRTACMCVTQQHTAISKHAISLHAGGARAH